MLEIDKRKQFCALIKNKCSLLGGARRLLRDCVYAALALDGFNQISHSHTDTRTHTSLVLHTYLRATCILICCSLPPCLHICRKWQQLYTYTHTFIYTHVSVCMCIYGQDMRHIRRSARKRIMAPTNCAELKRKMCRPAGRPHQAYTGSS